MPRKRKSEKPTVGTGESQTAASILNDYDDAAIRSLAASVLAKRRMALMTKQEHAEQSRRGGLACWAKMSPEEMALEQKRRALLGARRRRQKLRKRTGLD